LTSRRNFYFDAVEVVSKIATAPRSQSIDDIDHFWKIYYGRLAAVEDNLIDRAMVLFGDKLKKDSSTYWSPRCLFVVGPLREKIIGRRVEGGTRASARATL
jgi:hypothetical protein